MMRVEPLLRSWHTTGDPDAQRAPWSSDAALIYVKSCRPKDCYRKKQLMELGSSSIAEQRFVEPLSLATSDRIEFPIEWASAKTTRTRQENK
jgi:hypothetical protein